ncbi:MAG: ABC transporter ATP-binding protein [Christensenellales bacterium]|jgi:branched-chain amino acid transport system ATP-binding protein
MLEIKDIHVHYGVIEALKGVPFTVNDGEIVTLIGANGAGKTTMLHTISGIKKPTSGQILLDGQDITDTSARDRVQRGISQSPEGRRVFSTLTVLENLELGAFLRKDKAGIAQDLERVYSLFPRLADRRRQAAGTLSGGEQQMLALGRALMSRPKILLLDEPSMGLSPLLVMEIFNIIKTINETGTTILLVEQNARMALQIAHRAYVLETGSIVLSGTGAELMNSEEIKKAYLGG